VIPVNLRQATLANFLRLSHGSIVDFDQTDRRRAASFA
jgi:hypothetical protein